MTLMMFTLFVPFCEVCLHTFMDMLRSEEGREVNHHGKSISVQPTDLISRNEKIEVEARKNFYKNFRMKQQKKLKFLRKVAVVYIPILELLFIASYWYFGMRQYYKKI